MSGCAYGVVWNVPRGERGMRIACSECPGVDACDEGKIPQFGEAVAEPKLEDFVHQTQEPGTAPLPAAKKRGPKPKSTLSEREKEAVSLVREGKTYAEAADAMGTSRSTVESYVNRAVKKGGAIVEKRKVALVEETGPIPPEEAKFLDAIPAPSSGAQVFLDRQMEKIMAQQEDSLSAVDFSNYPDLLAWVKDMAVEDVRSPGQEIVALLKYARKTYTGVFGMMGKGKP